MAGRFSMKVFLVREEHGVRVGCPVIHLQQLCSLTSAQEREGGAEAQAEAVENHGMLKLQGSLCCEEVTAFRESWEGTGKLPELVSS